MSSDGHAIPSGEESTVVGRSDSPIGRMACEAGRRSASDVSVRWRVKRVGSPGRMRRAGRLVLRGFGRRSAVAVRPDVSAIRSSSSSALSQPCHHSPFKMHKAARLELHFVAHRIVTALQHYPDNADQQTRTRWEHGLAREMVSTAVRRLTQPGTPGLTYMAVVSVDGDRCDWDCHCTFHEVRI